MRIVYVCFTYFVCILFWLIFFSVLLKLIYIILSPCVLCMFALWLALCEWQLRLYVASAIIFIFSLVYVCTFCSCNFYVDFTPIFCVYCVCYGYARSRCVRLRCVCVCVGAAFVCGEFNYFYLFGWSLLFVFFFL